MQPLQRLLKRVFIIVVLSFTFVYLLPFCIAYNTWGLHENDFGSMHVRENVRQKYLDQKKQLALIDGKIAALETAIVDDDQANKEEKLRQKTILEKYRKEVKHKAIFSSFDYNRISLMWPLTIAILLFIYFVLLPGKMNFSAKRFFIVYFPLLIIFAFPTVLRSWFFSESDRVIYSVFNLDVNPYLFWFQQLLTAFSMAMIVLIWFKCLQQAKSAQQVPLTQMSFEQITKTMQSMKRHYLKWQVLSVCLIGVFGFFSYHFWRAVITEGDPRYIPQAIIFDVLWVITWIMASIPLHLEQQNWQGLVEKIMFRKSTETEMENNDIHTENFRKYISGFEVATSANKVISIGISLLSFSLPLIKLIIG